MGITNIELGQQAEVFALVKSAVKKKDVWKFVFSDKLGEVNAEYRVNTDKDLKVLIGKPVKAAVIGLPGEDDCILLGVQSIEETADAPLSALQASLPDEVLTKYEQEVEKLYVHIKDEALLALVKACFSPARMEKIKAMPASLSRHCTMGGGMLEAIAKMARGATEQGRYHSLLRNGVYHAKFDWALLVAAAMLHNYGNVVYYTDTLPRQKTLVGVNRGYLSCCESAIREVVVHDGIAIDELRLSELIGCIAQCTSYPNHGVKAMRPEGIILEGVYRTLTHLDMLEKSMSETSVKEGTEFYFDTHLRRYVAVDRTEERKEA